MRRNIFRVHDKKLGRYMLVARMNHGREYGFKHIYAFPPSDLFKELDKRGFIEHIYGNGVIVYKTTDLPKGVIDLEQWTGKGWAKVKMVTDSKEYQEVIARLEEE